MKKQFFITFLVLMSFLVVDECRVLGDELGKESLKGLTGVWVLIERFRDPNIREEGGLTTSQLQTDVELKLRKAAISVLTKEERLATKDAPCLYVRVNPVTIPEIPFYAYSIEVELKQTVLLIRNPSIEVVGCSTWARGMAGYAGKALFVKTIREVVGDMVDQFINDFLALNPITPAKPNVK
jgi:hypothetical protein